MVMKAYTKTIFRSFKANISRFIIIMAVTLLGIAFVSGLGNISPVIRASFSEGLKNQEISDLIVKNKTEQGFSSEEITSLAELDGVEEYEALFSLDTIINEEKTRFFCLDNTNFKSGSLELAEGRMPSAMNEILVEAESMSFSKKNINDTISYMGLELKIVGLVHNPLYFFRQGEAYLGSDSEATSLQDLEKLDSVIYSFKEYLPQVIGGMLPYTDLYLRLDYDGDYFTNCYNDYISEIKDKISTSYVVLDLQDNLSYHMLDSYCDKINIIVMIFPIFFIAVTALVVLSSMTRMIEEERSIVACFKTQGYSNGKIYFKYILFSLLSTLIGAVLGIISGVFILPSVIYPAFATVFYIPPMVFTVEATLGVIISLLMVSLMVLLTYYLLRKNLKCQCADLLKPKSPKSGAKILLEHIPFIWNRLSFKYKSSIRNIFRYKGHLIMTVVSVAGSTALAFAGFALYDISNVMEKYGYDGLKDTLIPISVVIIIFALLLCMLVVYNLTNMNIKERNKEMATLKVLGYHNIEATMYIYREILIMVLIGIIIGIPVGLGLIYFITKLLEFGALADIRVISYFLTAIIILLFILLVDLLLVRKIKIIDMTTSLKSVD